MLDISKIESGRVEFEYIPFDLKDLFDQCQRTVLSRATEKGIKLFFYVESQDDNKLLLGDPVRLRQVIINLLSNALKFTNVGMVRVTSFLRESTEDSKTFYFEIRDSGIGMTREQINRIFEPFMQADISITRKYGGTGLGLPITKNLISMMGGSLSVNSVIGVGSKFSFELVFKTLSALPKAEEHRVILEDLSHPPIFSGEVLVCEDNEMNQLVVAEHLERVGLKTVIAQNGQIGVNLVKERKQSRPFNLILMDIHMPIMDGLDAADKILALNTGTPIVAMTANIMTNDKDIYRQRGMQDCIGKPFTSKELWACLLKYLEPINL
jgi:CheY-like chemotaxis protein